MPEGTGRLVTAEELARFGQCQVAFCMAQDAACHAHPQRFFRNYRLRCQPQHLLRGCYGRWRPVAIKDDGDGAIGGTLYPRGASF